MKAARGQFTLASLSSYPEFCSGWCLPMDTGTVGGQFPAYWKPGGKGAHWWSSSRSAFQDPEQSERWKIDLERQTRNIHVECLQTRLLTDKGKIYNIFLKPPHIVIESLHCRKVPCFGGKWRLIPKACMTSAVNTWRMEHLFPWSKMPTALKAVKLWGWIPLGSMQGPLAFISFYFALKPS